MLTQIQQWLYYTQVILTINCLKAGLVENFVLLAVINDKHTVTERNKASV